MISSSLWDASTKLAVHVIPSLLFGSVSVVLVHALLGDRQRPREAMEALEAMEGQPDGGIVGGVSFSCP
jgi:hypothetical protein